MIRSPAAFAFRSSVPSEQSQRRKSDVPHQWLDLFRCSSSIGPVKFGGGSFGTGMTSGPAEGPKASSGRQFPPAKCARFSSALASALLQMLSALNFPPGGRLYRPAGSNSHANPSLSTGMDRTASSGYGISTPVPSRLCT